MCAHFASSKSDGPATSSSDPSMEEDVPSCVPGDQVSRSAFSYARQHLQAPILAHSLRVFLYARSIDARDSKQWVNAENLPLLFTASLFHDMGTCAAHDKPSEKPQRFEIEGADAAAGHLRSFSVSEPLVHEVWVAVALHTSPQLAERISQLARLVRLGVLVDFKRPAVAGFALPKEIENAETSFPRAEIEKVLGDAVVEQALKRPEKAPMVSWPGVMLRSKWENMDYEGVNKAF